MMVSGSAPPMRCGVGDYTARLAQALASNGIHVALLTSKLGTTAIPGVDVLPVMPDWRLQSLHQLWTGLRQWRPDIVHFQYPTLGYADGWLPVFLPTIARFAGSRVVRTWHEFAPWRSVIPWRQAVGFVMQVLPPGPIIVVRPRFREQLAGPLRLLARARRFIFVPNASAIPTSTLSEIERLTLAERLRGDACRLIASFGFLLPAKGVDLLFDIADPATDRLLIVGGSSLAPDYVATLKGRAEKTPWLGKVTFLENLSADEVADVLAAADAVVLPFRDGGGEWNSSIHAATAQGTPVVTTSAGTCGLDEARLVYTAPPDDIVALRAGVAAVARRRHGKDVRLDWDRIAATHRAIYEAELA